MSSICCELISFQNQIEIVEYLVEKNADVESADRWGRTSLHSAAWKNNLPLVQFFIENGMANIEATDNDGLTPLHFTAISFDGG